MYFVRLCTISDFNQLILVAAKADFHRMFNAGVPVGLRSGINEVVMVYMGHPVKLAAADNGLFIYRICTGYGYDKEEFNALYAEVVKEMRQLGFQGEVEQYHIGCTIGVHTGPTPIGIAVIRKYDA